MDVRKPFDRINKYTLPFSFRSFSFVCKREGKERRGRGERKKERERRREKKEKKSGKREFAFHPVYAHTAAESRTIFAEEKCNAQPAFNMAHGNRTCFLLCCVCRPLCTPSF